MSLEQRVGVHRGFSITADLPSPSSRYARTPTLAELKGSGWGCRSQISASVGCADHSILRPPTRAKSTNVFRRLSKWQGVTNNHPPNHVCDGEGGALQQEHFTHSRTGYSFDNTNRCEKKLETHIGAVVAATDSIRLDQGGWGGG